MNVNAFAPVFAFAFALALPRSLPAAPFDSAGPVQASEPVPSGARDLSRLQGCWKAKAGARRELEVTLEVEGRAVRVGIVTPQGMTIRARGELRIDESATPRALDWINFQVAGQGRFPDVPAIYTITDETLTICNGGPDGVRPGEFEPGDGVLADVVTFERASADAPARTNGDPIARRPGSAHPGSKLDSSWRSAP